MQFKTKSIHSAKHSSPASMIDKEPKRPDPEVLETKPRRRFRFTHCQGKDRKKIFHQNVATHGSLKIVGLKL
jgi:hypothetical protein